MLTAPPAQTGRPTRPGRPVEPAGPTGWSPLAWPTSDGPPTLALTVVTLASAVGLFRVFAGNSWIGPVVLTVLSAHLLLWILRRLHTPAGAAIPAAAMVVVLVVSWTVFGHTTWYGLPGRDTYSHIGKAIRSIGPEFSATVAPVTPIAAFEMLAAAGAGAVAIIGDWFAFGRRSPLAALLPGIGAFVVCASAGRGGGRWVVVAVEVAAVILFMVVDRATTLARQSWFAGDPRGAAGWAVGRGAAVSALALVAALSVLPALSTFDGVGAFGWRVGNGTGGGERIVPNPIVSLRSRLIKYSNTPVFAVQSSVASYWRLTSLDTFNGETWTSTGAYRSFKAKLPGVAAVPPGSRAVRASFRIQALDSVWLPDQFDPVEVTGVKNVSYDPGSDSLLTSDPTSNGQTYTVTSYQLLSTLSRAELESAPGVDPGALSADLQLPDTVSYSVRQLAGRIVADASTEYDKAIAIENFLRSPPFAYTLNPPYSGDDSSSDALSSFLFVQHQGYCQQFAGAYAVLARAVGLPTRLAVGFATGTSVAGGGFQVYDRDAHTWPEVYFGPRYGWVPFEPTPGFSIPGTSGYAGAGGAAGGARPETAPSVPTTAPLVAPSIVKPSPTPGKSSATTLPTPGAHRSHHSVSAWWLAVPGLAVLVALWAAAIDGTRAWRRRSRLRAAARAGPGVEVMARWDDVCGDLAWTGIRRSPWETDDEFARRADAAVDRRLGRQDWRHGGLAGMARLARRAAFAESVPRESAAQAASAAEEISDRLRRMEGRRGRIRRWFWVSPATAERLRQLTSAVTGADGD